MIKADTWILRDDGKMVVKTTERNMWNKNITHNYYYRNGEVAYGYPKTNNKGNK